MIRYLELQIINKSSSLEPGSWRNVFVDDNDDDYYSFFVKASRGAATVIFSYNFHCIVSVW